MKSFYLLLLIALIFTACNNTGKQLKERIVNADSIAINFFKGDGTMDTVVAVKIVRDKKTITKITDFVTASDKGSIDKCGYDGSIHFFKMNMVIQDIDFSLAKNAGCNQFTFLMQGQYQATKLSEDAAALLLNLKKK